MSRSVSQLQGGYSPAVPAGLQTLRPLQHDQHGRAGREGAAGASLGPRHGGRLVNQILALDHMKM